MEVFNRKAKIITLGSLLYIVFTHSPRIKTAKKLAAILVDLKNSIVLVDQHGGRDVTFKLSEADCSKLACLNPC